MGREHYDEYSYLTKENIWVKRPGKGHFKAKDYNRLLGKKSKKFIKKERINDPSNHLPSIWNVSTY